MPAELKQIMSLEVPVIVRLGDRLLRTSDVLGLRPGSIIELSKDADDELDLLINNCAIGRGSAVKIGENFGIRVSRVGDAKSRIEAMGRAGRPADGRGAGGPAGAEPAGADDAESDADDPISRVL